MFKISARLLKKEKKKVEKGALAPRDGDVLAARCSRLVNHPAIPQQIRHHDAGVKKIYANDAS